LNIENILQDTQLWNSLLALGVVIFLTIVLKGAFQFLISRLQRLAERTSGKWDDIVLYGLAGTKVWAIFIWLCAAALPLLKFHESVNQAGRHVAVLATAIQIMIWGLRAVGRWRDDFLEEKVGSDNSSVAAIGLLGTFLQSMLVILVALLALSNLGIDVGALIAGLGIGGIAIALAAQNVLGDLLASLSIVLDKPFVVGDFIVVGDKSGTVSHIGVKTTRLTSLTGEQLVFSNKTLLESQIQNFKRMNERRTLIKIGVTYSTDREKLGNIPVWLKAFVEENQKLRFDRCHFTGFGASSLDFELVFFTLSAEYNDFADTQQQVLFKILDKFSAEGVDFAYPSTSLYIEKSVPEAADRKIAAPTMNA
jgi:small-conductance mechanosensitive channel